MSLQAFRDAYAYEAGSLSYGEQQTQGLSPGQYTQYFNGTPRGGKANVLGMVFKFVGSLVVTASAPLNTIPSASTNAAPDYPFPNGGSFDDLDLIIGNGGVVEVCPSPGAPARAQAITRQFIEALWAESTNTSFTVPSAAVASGYTTANAGVSVTCYLFVPIGGIASVRIKLSAAVAGAISGQSVPPFASGATMSYTSVTSYIISSNFSGIAAFKEELTPSLGTSLQEFVRYVPADVAPDFIFMAGETSGSNPSVNSGNNSTISQVLITDTAGNEYVNCTDTDVLQYEAAQFAPIAGTTYTTKLGFVITGDARVFRSFKMNFVFSSVHFIAYFQMAGGEDTYPNKAPAQTAAPPATSATGTETAGGMVAAKRPGSGGGGGSKLASGSAGAIISRRSG